MQVHDKIVELRENANLFARCSLLQSKREFDMEDVVGNHELATVLRSLFKADGILISESEGKSAAIKVILENTGVEKTTVTPTHIDCVVIDAMRVVNEINLKIALLKTGADFADEFNKRIGNISQHASMIMIVYDRYEKRSLKNVTSSKRMGKWSNKMPRTFAINEMTNIEGVNMDELMASTETKDSIVTFLMRTTELYLKSQHVYMWQGMELSLQTMLMILQQITRKLLR